MKSKTPYLIILAAILILAAAYGARVYLSGNTGGNAPAGETGETKTFEITAQKFQFTPDQITVNRGDRVRLSFTSLDVAHGFKLDGYGINKTINPGEPVLVEFLADKPGTFEFRCSIPCGEGHLDMKGILTVN